MGLLDWLKGTPSPPVHPGPTPEGVYGILPKDMNWGIGTDPAAVNAHSFIPTSADLVLDLVECEWRDDYLKAIGLTRWGDRILGFGILLPLSDGARVDSVQRMGLSRAGKAIDQGRVQWTIPKRHPTRELILVSLGEPTSNLLRLFESCFGFETTEREAIPANSGIMSELVILRGRIVPAQDRLTARCKAFLRTSEAEDDTYAEFFLNINTVTRKMWVSEKALDYRQPIYGWAAGAITRTQ